MQGRNRRLDRNNHASADGEARTKTTTNPPWHTCGAVARPLRCPSLYALQSSTSERNSSKPAVARAGDFASGSASATATIATSSEFATLSPLSVSILTGVSSEAHRSRSPR